MLSTNKCTPVSMSRKATGLGPEALTVVRYQHHLSCNFERTSRCGTLSHEYQAEVPASHNLYTGAIRAHQIFAQDKKRWKIKTWKYPCDLHVQRQSCTQMVPFETNTKAIHMMDRLLSCRLATFYTILTQSLHNLYTIFTQLLHNRYTTFTQPLQNVYILPMVAAIRKDLACQGFQTPAAWQHQHQQHSHLLLQLEQLLPSLLRLHKQTHPSCLLHWKAQSLQCPLLGSCQAPIGLLRKMPDWKAGHMQQSQEWEVGCRHGSGLWCRLCLCLIPGKQSWLWWVACPFW